MTTVDVNVAECGFSPRLVFWVNFCSSVPLNLLLSAVFLLLLTAAAQSLQGVGAASSLRFCGLLHACSDNLNMVIPPLQ